MAIPIFIVTLYEPGPDGLPYNEYEIPQSDIHSAGEQQSVLRREMPLDFSDIVPPDLTLYLLNPDGKYTPGLADYIYAGADPSIERGVRVEMADRRPGTDLPILDGRTTLYEGLIQSWKTLHIGVEEGGSRVEFPLAEIYSRSALGEALDLRVGEPDETTGEAQPLVFGRLMHEADSMADQNPAPPSKEAQFESGAVTGADAYDSLSQVGGGTVVISAGQAYQGVYCARHRVDGTTIGGQALGSLALTAGAPVAQYSWRFYVDELPADSIGNNWIAEIYNSVGTVICWLKVLTGFQVQANWITTTSVYNNLDFWLNSYQGTYCRITVVLDQTANTQKIFLNGSEIFSGTYNLSGSDSKTLWVGPRIALAGQIWSCYVDDIKIWNSFYPNLYQLPGGGAYQSIDRVYVDGAVVNYELPANRRSRRAYNQKHWLQKRYGKKGTTPSSALMTLLPQYGAVSFGVDVQSAVLLEATRNAVSHPGDIIQALLAAVFADARVDSDSFAQAKTAAPGDQVGCMFADMTCRDAISEVCALCLYYFWERRARAFLRPYAALPEPPTGVITDADFYRCEMERSRENVFKKVRATYGWHERNPGLKVIRAALDFKDGDQTEKLEGDWGQAVGTDSQAMVADKTAKLCQRLQGPRDLYNLLGFPQLAALEPGEAVTLNSRRVSPAPLDLFIYRNNPNLGLGRVEMGLVKFLGEDMPAPA